MKTKFYLSWKAALVLAGLPFVAAALQSPPAGNNPQTGQTADGASLTTMAEVPGGSTPTNQSAPVAASAQPTGPTLPNLQLYGGTAEIVKLAQSGVGEGVMMSYISNTTARFSLGSDQIIYLNDLGVSATVVTAMIQHDAAQDATGTTLPPATATYPPNQTDVATYPPGQTVDQPVPATDYVDYNTYPPADYSTPDDTAYFYDTLAPYGSWINVAGFGLCWQPIVYVRNHDWRPYNDRGRWLYTDCGWYWQSDYSWGWAAFHYGRWYRDASAGWVWAPNRVWGPAWVSWRNSAEYCGWAPLPPSANFVPGIGFRFRNHAVNASFEFGLRRGLYTFVPTERLVDYSPSRYRVTGAAATRIFGESAVINHFTTENHQVINHGVDPKLVEARAGTPIRRAVIHEMAAGSGNGHFQPDRLDKRGDSLVLYRPQLPATPARSSSLNSGAPKATPVVSTAGPNGTRTVSGAPTASGRDEVPKPHVQVYTRPDAAPAVSTVQIPAKANAGNSAAGPAHSGTYPPNSLVLVGRRNLTDPQFVAQPSPVNAGTTPSQPARTRPETFTVYQRPDLSGNAPQPGTPARVELSHDGPARDRVTVYQRPDLSGNVQPDQGGTAQPGRGGGNIDLNRGYGGRFGNQSSPAGNATQPVQSPSPAQAPVLLPSRGQGNYGGYSPPAHNSVPAYSPPVSHSAPVYNPQPQPIQLPPSHTQSAPAPAPAPASHSSAPAQSSQSSSSQSQSSGHR